MTEIWFIRHGQSESNAGIRTVARGLPPLTELGWEQARSVVAQINRQPDLFAISPFVRTQQTAEPTLEKYPNVPTEIWPIQECTQIGLRHYENSLPKSRGQLFHDYWERDDPHFVDGEGAESWMMIADRIEKSFELAEANPANFIVAFSHGMFMRTMMWYLIISRNNNRETTRAKFEKSMSAFRAYSQHQHIPNTSILPIRIENGNVWMAQLRDTHCDAHIETASK